MALEELDYMAVYLNYIHKTPLSESGSSTTVLSDLTFFAQF